MIIAPMPVQVPPAQIIILSDNEFKNTTKDIMLCIEERTEEQQYSNNAVLNYSLPFSKLMPLEDKPVYSDFPSIISNYA